MDGGEELPGAARRRLIVLVIVAAWLSTSFVSQMTAHPPRESETVVVRDRLPVVKEGRGNETIVVSFFNAETKEVNRRGG